MFTLFKGQKIFFFQKWPKYGLILEKKIKNSSSSFFQNRGGIKPEMTNVIFFFLMKASLIMDRGRQWTQYNHYYMINMSSVLFFKLLDFRLIRLGWTKPLEKSPSWKLTTDDNSVSLPRSWLVSKFFLFHFFHSLGKGLFIVPLILLSNNCPRAWD